MPLHCGSVSFGNLGDADTRPWVGGMVPIRAPMDSGKIRRGGGSFRGAPRQSDLLPRRSRDSCAPGNGHTVPGGAVRSEYAA